MRAEPISEYMAAARSPPLSAPRNRKFLRLGKILPKRKNYLFAGADTGGERAAAMYTLMETAKLNDIDPEAYLRHVFAHIADHPINRIDELLPWHVAEAGKLATSLP